MCSCDLTRGYKHGNHCEAKLSTPRDSLRGMRCLPVKKKTSYDCYRGADKSLGRYTSRYILFHGENLSFDASLVLYIHIHTYIYIYITRLACTHTHTHTHTHAHTNSTNISQITIINRIYENQNLLSL